MNEIKKGDIVGRISYGKDIFFTVERIINVNSKKLAILKGVTLRIEADAYIEDLELIDKKIIENNLRSFEINLEERIKKYHEKNINILDCFRFERKKEIEISHFGTILHLDGDRRYAEKSSRYYRKMGLNAVIKYVSESKQPKVVYELLNNYRPDILVITGHDGMIKKNVNYSDIYNYRNSKYFINTVIEARKWTSYNNNLVIFAGACQSYYEALIGAGANFASSPARILIDFMDPLIVAQKIAMTDEEKFIRVEDFSNELRDGTRGIGGIGANGKRKVIFL